MNIFIMLEFKALYAFFICNNNNKIIANIYKALSVYQTLFTLLYLQEFILPIVLSVDRLALILVKYLLEECWRSCPGYIFGLGMDLSFSWGTTRLSNNWKKSRRERVQVHLQL